MNTTMKVVAVAAIPFIVAFGGLATVYATLGRTAATALILHGGAVFLPISPKSARLTPAVRRVLAGDVGTPKPGRFAWQMTEPGFAVGELPVLVGADEVDRLLLAKVDPARFRIVARNDPSATTTVDGWMRRLDAKLVVNGSFYAPSGLPDTPFVADGRKLGPDPYDAVQGALVVAAGGATSIYDLARANWHDVLASARDALVSYPLLLGPDGKARPIKPSSWLANRTFVGIDARGWVVFGTTKDAYFSLARLATFLEQTPLDLRATLNLDGGPIACQAIRSGGFTRRYCGDQELHAGPDGVSKLTWLYGVWTLPVAVAVVTRAPATRLAP